MTLDRRAIIIGLENDLEQTVDGIGRLGERGKQTLSFKTFNNMRHLDKDGEAGVWLLTGSAKRRKGKMETVDGNGTSTKTSSGTHGEKQTKDTERTIH